MNIVCVCVWWWWGGGGQGSEYWGGGKGGGQNFCRMQTDRRPRPQSVPNNNVSHTEN